MQRVLIIGSGGLARDFLSWFGTTVEVVGFVTRNLEDHARYQLPGSVFLDGAGPAEVDADAAVLAIGTPTLKQRLANELQELGFSFPTFVHPSAVIAPTAQLGRGVIICPQCVVSPDVVMGDFSYLNYSSGVGHNTVVGAFTQINPGAQIGGNCTIGEAALIGSGSVILHERTIGERAVIASGAAIFGRVAAGVTMMGNPASRFRPFDS